MINQKTFTTIPGSIARWSGLFIHRNILVVHREGVEYDIINLATLINQGGVGNRQVFHHAGRGLLVFKIPFEVNEKLNVIYVV